MTLVRLPSGATAPLEVPGLAALLAAHGDAVAIATRSFDHDEVEASELFDSDIEYIAEWALCEFAAGEEALALVAICECWGRSPSQVLGVSDPTLAWLLEQSLFLRVRSERGREADAGEEEGIVRFTIDEGAA